MYVLTCCIHNNFTIHRTLAVAITSVTSRSRFIVTKALECVPCGPGQCRHYAKCSDMCPCPITHVSTIPLPFSSLDVVYSHDLHLFDQAL